MIVTSLLVAALAVAVERVVEVQLGLPGIVGMLLLRTGITTKSGACVIVGSVLLFALVIWG
ncbi:MULTISPECIES: hypothetical protein [Streptomyces]|uniref:Uncharacterized protein n=3 Tax=Streptomyces TaxID=1883 RepID=A0A7X6D2X9_9ACTN|nr:MULTISPECIES: hypothetical protein [Streptomyces]NJP69080.1 hypothetical protein [Streptomyces spiramenti]NJQ07209.1 hypothetical protein [Streptomyces lonarensis]NJQ14934.1 hypothetical protein [Streptomyces bohaiensis]